LKLPISVVIPTLNCRHKLGRHLDALEGWLQNVSQVIAVDSHSSDGTRELLEARLQQYGAEILLTEPGLYKSWNLAIARANQPYLYLSTIGDTIDSGGIEFLYKKSVAHDLDLLITAPQIVNEDGMGISEIKWPIHQLEEFLESKHGFFMPSQEQCFLLGSSFLPESIIGSSASNLYRTSILREHPFPEDRGHCGDAIWTIANLHRFKVGLSSERVALFCWDGMRKKGWKYTLDALGEMMAELEKFRNLGSDSENLLFNCLMDSTRKIRHLASNNYRMDLWVESIFKSRLISFKIKVIDKLRLRRRFKVMVRKLRK
jgi:glycosyltransferase involved in cell wall biosynthesis